MDEDTRKPLSDKMERVFRYIRNEIITTGVPPSRPQAATALDLSVSTITWYLKELEKRGWLTLVKGSRRGIRLVQGSGIPVIEPPDSIAPDVPLRAERHIAEYMPEILATAYAPDADFFMRIGTGSMEAPGYRSGDLVGVRATDEPRVGQVAVVRVDEEVRFRVFRRQTKRALVLVELNVQGKPGSDETIELKKHQVHIEGVVVHTFRALDLQDFDYLDQPEDDNLDQPEYDWLHPDYDWLYRQEDDYFHQPEDDNRDQPEE